MMANGFQSWAAAGFGPELIPIIPPGATLSPMSGIKPEHLGKIPGRRNGQGVWAGFRWEDYPTSPQDLDHWDAAGAGIGLRTACFPAVDIDVTDKVLAELIEKTALQVLGPAPRRIGRAPKRALAYRTEAPFGKLVLHVGRAGEKPEHKVEVLGAGQQYVVEGTHRGRPYTWNARPRTSELTLIDRAMVERLLTELERVLPEHGFSVQRGSAGHTCGDRSWIDQEALKGDIEAVARAVALIPNTVSIDRHAYVGMGHAIKAACANDLARGLEIYQEWAARWEGGANDTEEVEHRWSGLKPPFEIGASWIFEQAQPFGFNAAGEEFEALEPAPAEAPKPTPRGLTEIRPIDFTQKPDIEPAPREFLVEELLPCVVLTSLYGPGGVGKSLLAQQIATCIATGNEVFGLAVKQCPVLALFSEDDNDELERRQWRINRELGLHNEDLGRLHLEGRSGTVNALVTFPSGAPKTEQLAKTIVRKARELGAGLIILDNRAQMILGNENDRMVATYGGNLCARIGRKAGAAVLLVGHPAKPVGSQYSGSTAWDAVTRSRWWLERLLAQEGQENAPTRLLLTLVKSNYAPTGRRLTLVWADGVLRLADDSLSPDEQAEAEFHQGQARAAFLGHLGELATQGRWVSHAPSARNYAPKVMTRLASCFHAERELERAMEQLFAEGSIIGGAPVGRYGNRTMAYGIARAGAGAADPEETDL
jgi:RecA-family ATPase